MDNNMLLEYNLSKIAQIDSELVNNKKEKEKFVKSYRLKLKICNFISWLYRYKVIAVLIGIVSLVIYLFIKNAIASIFISLFLVALINFILLTIIYKIEPKDNYFEMIEDYDKQNESLLSKRNTYINIYNYILKGEEAIINNIKLKIHNKCSYNYDNNLDKLWINQDKYAYDLVMEMKNKENILIRSIKSKVDWELRSPIKDEEISSEQLTMLANAL